MAGVRVRIEALRWRPFSLPLRDPFVAVHAAVETREGMVVELRDELGRVGVGEASPLPSLGGGTAEDVQTLLERTAGEIVASGGVPARLDGPGSAALLAALDVALLDLTAQRLGLPIAALLVEAPARMVRVNAVAGDASRDDLVEAARNAEEAGYEVLKVKVGVDALDEDLERLAAVRDVCPALTLRIDANGAWDRATARRALRACSELDGEPLDLVEQPVAANDIEGLAELRRAFALPIAADEAVDSPAAVERLLASRAVDALVLKPQRLGGLQPALEVARRGLEAGLRCIVTTTVDSSIGNAAALHLAAAVEALSGANEAHGLATGEQLAGDVVGAPLLPREGALELPSERGLGVVLDEASLEAVATGAWRAVEA